MSQDQTTVTVFLCSLLNLFSIKHIRDVGTTKAEDFGTMIKKFLASSRVQNLRKSKTMCGELSNDRVLRGQQENSADLGAGVIYHAYLRLIMRDFRDSS